MAAGLLGVVEHPQPHRELVAILSLAAPGDDTRQTLERRVLLPASTTCALTTSDGCAHA
jgi:hypothetical protein